MFDSVTGAMVDAAAEQPEHPGEQLIARVQGSVDAYQKGREEALTDFAAQLRAMAERDLSAHVSVALLDVADIAERVAGGGRATRHCYGCHEDLDNHYPCGQIECPCYCMHPDTPEDMKRPPRKVGS